MSKQLPNLITLLRFFLTLLIVGCILIDCGSILLPLILSIIVFASDFADGRMARRAGSASYFGAVFDITADLFYITAMYGVLVYLNIAPFWFVAVILMKFTEFVLTSYFLKRYSSANQHFFFDLIGRFAALLFYGVPLMIFLLYNLSQPIFYFFESVILFIISVIALASAVYRGWTCLSSWRHETRKHKIGEEVYP